MVVDRFLGEWSIDRAVVDARAGVEGRLRGTARFEPTADEGVAYVEHGVLTFGDDVLPAVRRLLLRSAGARSVDVLFGDGRPFYRFDVVDDRWAAEHSCGRDTYTVAGRFLGDDWFEEVWHATGPLKDYRLTTLYRRPVAAERSGRVRAADARAVGRPASGARRRTGRPRPSPRG
ncbi:DUF6314 family protein [Cellulomonas sp. URHB0016]